MSSMCTTCPVQPYLCLAQQNCSACPAPVKPDKYPPATTPGMLSQALVSYPNQSQCPLNLSLENPEQWCYMNELAASPGTPFLSNLPTNAVLGVDRNSWGSGPTRCDQHYLIPPFDSQDASEIEFLTAPPDANGQPQCTYFDTYTPKQCTTPQCDCTTRCLYDGSLPCIPGTQPVKVGPCLTNPSWQGWTMQGYQCKPVNWGCNWKTGKCELDPSGPYGSEEACKNGCIVCPAQGFQVLKDPKSGNEMCYRTPFQNDANDSCGSRGAVCKEDACYNTNPNACGVALGWIPDCSEGKGHCIDSYTTPNGGFQCTTSGYVQCTDPNGCAPPRIPVSDYHYLLCELPPHLNVLRGDANHQNV